MQRKTLVKCLSLFMLLAVRLAVAAISSASSTVTVIGFSLPILFGGSVIIETIFQWPGIGLMFMNAITGRDSPVIMGYVLFWAIIVLATNLLTDIVYSVAEPRIRDD